MYNYTRLTEMERAGATLAEKGFIGDVYSDNSGKSAHVAPLYAILLSGIYIIFGWDTAGGRLLQELLAIAATIAGICLLPKIARKAGLSEISGWAAAFSMAILPINLSLESSGSWEQPFAALALLGMFWAFCTLRAEKWGRWSTIIITGALLGMIALLSPSLLPAAILMTVIEIWNQRQRALRVCFAGMVMAAISIVSITPWIIRNYYALGGIIPIRSSFGIVLEIGNNPLANGMGYYTSWDDYNDPLIRRHPFSNVEEKARLMELGELRYMKEKERAALQWIKANPLKFVELTIRRFVLFWFPTLDAWLKESPTRHLKRISYCLIGLFALAGLYRLWWVEHQNAGLMAAALVGPTLVYLISFVDPRYRYPIFGLSTVIACDFLISIGKLVITRFSDSDRLG